MLFLIQSIYRFVDDNPLEPGPKGRIASIAIEIAERTDKGFLQYILGVFFTSRNPVANIKHSFCVQFIYPVMGITVACPATCNQIRMNVQTRRIQPSPAVNV